MPCTSAATYRKWNNNPAHGDDKKFANPAAGTSSKQEGHLALIDLKTLGTDVIPPNRQVVLHQQLDGL